MKAARILTTNGLTSTEDTTVDRIARLLWGREASAVPVVDAEDHVVGIVTERDFVHSAENGTERRRSRRNTVVDDRAQRLTLMNDMRSERGLPRFRGRRGREWGHVFQGFRRVGERMSSAADCGRECSPSQSRTKPSRHG